MNLRDQILDIFTMQDQLNTAILGPDWPQQDIPWNIAASQELSEAIDCVPWKWWTKGETNYPNMKLEFTDALLFAFSGIIAMQKRGEEGLDLLADFTAEMFEEAMAVPQSQSTLIGSPRHMAAAIGHLQHTMLKDVFYAKIYYNVIYGCGFTLQEIFDLYRKKTALNFFRQLNGYRTGTYKKIWNEKEDNYYLEALKLTNEPIRAIILEIGRVYEVVNGETPVTDLSRLLR